MHEYSSGVFMHGCLQSRLKPQVRSVDTSPSEAGAIRSETTTQELYDQKTKVRHRSRYKKEQRLR